MNNVTLTGDAIKRISFLQEQESEDAKLRIEVHGGGCSGFSYGFRFDTEVNGDDLVIQEGDHPQCLGIMIKATVGLH